MFGLSLAEIAVLAVVGLVVVGPRKLPALMRQAGMWVGKLRRMSVDLRSQSGIDDLIRQEGLEHEIAQLRNLSRVNVLDTVLSPVMSAVAAAESSSTRASEASRPAAASRAAMDGPRAPVDASRLVVADDEPLRARELPVLGCDHYGALPDDSDPYCDMDTTELTEREAPVCGCDAYGAICEEPSQESAAS